VNIEQIISTVGIKPYYQETSGIIYHADCRVIVPKLSNNCVDLVLTDPPYGIALENNRTGGRIDGEKYKFVSWDKRPTNDFLKIIKQISKNQIIWGANYFNCFSDEGGAIVWDKLQPLSSSSQCEIASVSGYKKVFKYTQRWTNYVNTKQTDHPTEKPKELMEWIIENFSNENDLIIDPFLGSGTTIVAAKKLGRRFIGIEIEEKNCKVSARRLGVWIPESNENKKGLFL